MNLQDAIRIASMTDADLEDALDKSGYQCSSIIDTVSVDIREKDVKFVVQFKNDGSCEDEQLDEEGYIRGTLFVNLNGEVEFG